MAANPLLDHFGLPAFEKIKPEHVVPAVEEMLKRNAARLKDLEKNAKPTWAGVVEPLEIMDREASMIYGPVTHLMGVKNSPELRQAYETMQPKVVEHGLREMQSRPLYDAFVKMKASPQWSTMPPAQKRIIEHRIRMAKLYGIELEGAKKERFNAISKKLSTLSTTFSNHVLDSTKEFKLILTKAEEVDGLPASYKAMAAQSYNTSKETDAPAATAENGPWLVTLDMPSYSPFMEHGKNRFLREKLYRAQISRASQGTYDNSPLIKEILELRHEQAELLGYKSYAAMSLASKMAEKPASVEKFLDELYQASHKHVLRERQDLENFARTLGFKEEFMHWDKQFYAERMREQKFAYTEEELRPYFPLPKVLEGLFKLVNRIFGVTVKGASRKVETWHPDVQFFEVFDDKGAQVAAFYLDPYSRPENKRGGAWMDSCHDRGVFNGNLQLPVAYLVCNGTPPVGDKPSLLTFAEVETLFHEFGHGLQHMLTKVSHVHVSGINGVEWDAVELPSQFMENWCYDEPTLMSLTAHYETGESLPKALFDKILKARTFLAATAMVRQLHFAMTDLTLHHGFDLGGKDTVFDVYCRVGKKVLEHPPLPEDRMLCSFSHIFAGGYAAGYYSYKWAEVLSADAFGAFEEVGLANEDKVRAVGKKFRDTVLALGGSEHPKEVFMKFRGREPSIEPLLRHSGLR